MELEKPKESGGPGIWQVIKNRRSRREFSSEPVTLAELSQLLWASTGITGKSGGCDLRAAPSAGATYPIETYIVANRVNGLDNGVYHYGIKKNELVETKKGDFGQTLSEAAFGQDIVKDAAVVFIWAVILERTAKKYGKRAERYVFIDAGHIAENLLLGAEALGLAACPVGAFDDKAVGDLLNIDGGKTAYMAVVGRKA